MDLTRTRKVKQYLNSEIQTSENIDLLQFFSYIKVMCSRNKHRNKVHNLDSVGGKPSPGL